MQKVDLLHGRILPSLAKLAFPIMATQLIQMAYNLTDMIWIGRVGSGAVAAVGLRACICGWPTGWLPFLGWAGR